MTQYAPGISSAIDTLSFDGATKLAAKIHEYWKAKGFPDVKTELTEIRAKSQNNGIFGYGVRSNLLRGLPRGDQP